MQPNCARICSRAFPTTWCRPPSSRSTSSRSHQTESSTATRCPRPRPIPGKPIWLPATRPSRPSPAFWPACSASTASASTTISSNSAATRFWPSRWSRAPTGDGWHQAHAGWDDHVAFDHFDLSGLDAEACIPALTRQADRLQQSLDLAAGPVLRAALFDLGARGQRLLLIIHHLVVDGVSWRILLEDLGGVYAALADGTPVQLPAKTASFKSWAESLSDYAQSAVAQR